MAPKCLRQSSDTGPTATNPAFTRCTTDFTRTLLIRHYAAFPHVVGGNLWSFLPSWGRR